MVDSVHLTLRKDGDQLAVASHWRHFINDFNEVENQSTLFKEACEKLFDNYMKRKNCMDLCDLMTAELKINALDQILKIGNHGLLLILVGENQKIRSCVDISSVLEPY